MGMVGRKMTGNNAYFYILIGFAAYFMNSVFHQLPFPLRRAQNDIDIIINHFFKNVTILLSVYQYNIVRRI